MKHGGTKAMRASAAAIFATIALAGCSGVQSERIDHGAAQSPTANLVYYLPKRVVELSIIDAGENEVPRYRINVDPESDVRLTRDPVHVYALRYVENPLSEDDVKANIDGATGFLSLAGFKAVDRSGTVLENVAKTAGLFLAEDVEAGVILQLTVDPHDLGEANARIAPYGIALRCHGCTPPTPVPPTGAAADGFYSRPFYEIQLEALLENKQIFSIGMLSPNGSPLVLHRLRRSLGGERNTNYTAFKDGVPINYTEQAPAALVGLTVGVFTAAGEIVSAPLKGIQRSLAETQEEEKLLQAEANVVEAQTKLVNAQKALEDARNGAQGENEEGDVNGSKAPIDPNDVDAPQ